MTHIVNSLFPDHDELPLVRSREDSEVSEIFIHKKLEAAVIHMKSNKAPGPDGIPSEVMKIIAEE